MFTEKQFKKFIGKHVKKWDSTVEDYLGIYEEDNLYWCSIPGKQTVKKESRKGATIVLEFYENELLVFRIWVPALKLHFVLYEDEELISKSNGEMQAC